MTHQEISALVNALLKTCDDVERVLRCAAEKVQSSEHAVVVACLGENCQQRSRELHNYLVSMGGHASARRHRWVAVQRALLSLRSLFHIDFDLEMLKACYSSQERAITHYRRALAEPLPEPLRIMLERQCMVAKCNSARISDVIVLEQSIAPSSRGQTTLTARRPFGNDQGHA